MKADLTTEISGLLWIHQDVDERLRQARQVLEEFVDEARDELNEASDALHQVHRVLGVARIYGGAMFAGELERQATALTRGGVSDRHVAAEALMLGIARLPGYLERVERGEPDIPLVLLPLFNELRAARGQPAVSRVSMYLPQLDVELATQPVEHGSGNPELPAIVRAHRVNYHRGLLGWMKNEDAGRGIQDMRAFLDEIAQAAGTPRLRRFLEAAGALLAAIGAGDVEATPALKVVVGRFDRVFKTIIDEGEERAVEEFPFDLYKNILRHVADSDSRNPAVQALRDTIDLENGFPEISEDEMSSPELGGVDREVLAAVGGALREDLDLITDRLDLYQRDDSHDLQRFAGLGDSLRRMADTLGMLGRSDLRERLIPHLDVVRAAATEGQVPSENALTRLAGDLLVIESALKDLPETGGRVRAGSDRRETDVPDGGMSGADYREHVQATIDLVLPELAKIKESLGLFVEDPDSPTLLSGIPQVLHSLGGALTIVSQPRACRLMRGMGRYIERVISGERAAPDTGEADALADLLGGVEYYLSDLLQPSLGHDRALDTAEQALVRLLGDEALLDVANALPQESEWVAEAQVPQASREVAEEVDHGSPEETSGLAPGTVQEEAAEETLEAVDEAASEEVSEEGLEAVADEASEEVPEATPEEVPEVVAEETHEAVDEQASEEVREEDLEAVAEKVPEAMPEEVAERIPQASAEEVAEEEALDPEILEIFLEEAREELANIQTQYPLWREETGAEEPLTLLRRSFHTLKGSGRLVGANEIGEFAWSMENLLNRVMDGTVRPAVEVKQTLGEAVDLLPVLIERREKGGAADSRVEPLQERAFALARNESPTPLKLEPESGEPAAGAPEGAAEEPDTESVSSLERGGTPEMVEETGGAGTAASIQSADEPAPVTEHMQAPAPIVLEPALFGIFEREAREHLQALGRGLDACRNQPGTCAHDDRLKRSLHTLRGSAHMANVQPVADVAGAVEKWLSLCADLEQAVTPSDLDLLQRGHSVMGRLLDVINRAGAEMPEWQGLVHEVNQRIEDLDQQVRHAAAEDQVEIPTRDEELVGIFTEEARELIDSLESAYSDWGRRPRDRDAVSRIQRNLHTMKGGARLASLSEVGDLAHATESLFEGIAERRVEVTPGMQGLVRQTLDILSGQVEELERGGALMAHPELVDALEAAGKGEAWVPVSQAPLPDIDSTAEDESIAPLSNAAPDIPVGEDEEMEESDLLPDSQLLTDSELLDETDLLTPSALVPGDGDLFSSLTDDSRVIRFPGQGGRQESDEEIPRRPPPEKKESSTASRERVRVSAGLLDQMVNNAGEVSIYRARLEQQNKTLGYNLDELFQTIGRLREQLRKLENETEAQILSRHEREHEGDLPHDFDPLEMDRYSSIQQLSRALSETTEDLNNIGTTVDDLSRDTEVLLQQQARLANDLQDGLLRTRMVPVGSRTSRLQRVVRQTAQTLGKQAELSIQGEQGEMDRTILERMIGPLEHLLRNAVAHGIESTEERIAAAKPPGGTVSLEVGRDGSDVVLSVSDDGRGLDREAIRRKAEDRGLIDPQSDIEGEELDAFILEAGLSTSDDVSQVSGRGVGMDVVVSEVKQLGGSLEIDSQPGRGTRFNIRLPFTLAISEALLVGVGDEVFVVPHGSMDGITRMPRDQLAACYRGEQDRFNYGGHEYAVRYLGAMLGLGAPALPETERWLPVLLVRSGDHRIAIQVDRLLGNRQVVVKSVGKQLSSIRWFSGGTILADGRIALILDMISLIRMSTAHQAVPAQPGVEASAAGIKVMVVDDSITVRKVTGRLLERHNMGVITARDGVDALALLQEEKPDVMLLDIEMPRMDGFELARHMRGAADLKKIPIIMITSRTGAKHRLHATELGIERYLGKPYQEAELLENIYSALAESAT